jgi:23S rRNA (cytosine1962-C5)-methyltransferase
MAAFAHESELIKLPLELLLQSRVSNARDLRRNLGIPDPQATTAYRLVNGEGDLLSGITVDIFGRAAVVQSTALWAEIHRDKIISSIAAALPDVTSFHWRRSLNFLAMDGYKQNSNESSDLNPASAIVTVLENGLKYRVSPGTGQKTGFYCDQRDNRLLIRNMCNRGFNFQFLFFAR